MKKLEVEGFPVSQEDLDQIAEWNGSLHILRKREFIYDNIGNESETNANTDEEVIAGLRVVVSYIRHLKALVLDDKYDGM